ncbi:protein amalgam-like isoform X2 [Mizuhopecten yessoensis]|uniref:Myosin light chain kinase, smooth muscle n=1 Tax=Mizuhopecten yessoensis TaxID=6573 RepID=A0A210PTF4_MIZYE|nr:protein amalgam-like isoform X2 [Mizuhopecten yessoensis]OWF39779.1 Myosin light chain kinase, smooth muscle [Mizuhopecten yessoensis]
MVVLPVSDTFLASTALGLVLMILSALPSEAVRYMRPMFNDMESNVTAYVGDSAVLECSVRNLGTKSVIWKRKSEKHALTIGDFVFTSDNSYSVEHADRSQIWALVIKNVQKEHAGEYECQISTKEDLNKTVSLTVLAASRQTPVGTKIVQVKNNRKLAVQLGGGGFVEKGNPITLSCNATGKLMTPDDIDWFKDGIKIKSSARNTIHITKHRMPETRTLVSKLRIKHSNMSDAGTYICRSTDLKVKGIYVSVLSSETNPMKREDKTSDISGQCRLHNLPIHVLLAFFSLVYLLASVH